MRVLSINNGHSTTVDTLYGDGLGHADLRSGGIGAVTRHFAREACRRRNPPQNVIAQDNRDDTSIRVILKAAGVQSPAVWFAAIGRARGTGLLGAGVGPATPHTVCLALRGSAWTCCSLIGLRKSVRVTSVLAETEELSE